MRMTSKRPFDKLKGLLRQLLPKESNVGNINLKSIKNMLETLQLENIDVLGVSEDTVIWMNECIQAK